MEHFSSIISVCMPVHENVYVQRLVQEGWAGNGCMYNASAVHFQSSKAHDAEDAPSELMPTTLLGRSHTRQSYHAQARLPPKVRIIWLV